LLLVQSRNQIGYQICIVLFGSVTRTKITPANSETSNGCDLPKAIIVWDNTGNICTSDSSTYPIGSFAYPDQQSAKIHPKRFSKLVVNDLGTGFDRQQKRGPNCLRAFYATLHGQYGTFLFRIMNCFLLAFGISITPLLGVKLDSARNVRYGNFRSLSRAEKRSTFWQLYAPRLAAVTYTANRRSPVNFPTI
jgi:hypothetical protein